MATEFSDFAFDFGLTFFEPPSQKKDVTTGGLTEREYLQGNVDFYDQKLGQTLGTGIDVRFRDKREDEDEDEDEDGDEGRDVDISRVGGGDDKSPMSFAEMESVVNKDPISAKNIYDVNIGTYGEALSKAGFADKTPFNFFGQEIYTASVPKTKDEVKRGLERFVSKQGLIDKAVKTGARMMGMNPLISGTAYSFVNGKTIDDPLGNPSFRPNHFALGFIHDINMSIQYDNINAIQASLRDPKSNRRGFASYINGQLVTRAPGKFAYSGTGAIGLDVQTLQRIDALSKGIVPDSYDYRDESGDKGIPTGDGGMYDNRGVYHDVNGSYSMGRMSSVENLAKTYGLKTDKALEILRDVRKANYRGIFSKYGTTKNLTEEIAKAQAKNFEEVQKAQRETVKQRIQEDPSVTNIPTGPENYGITSGTYSAFQDTTPQVDYGDDDSDDTGGTSTGADSSDMGFSTRYGGQIGEGMQEGGPAGFIGGPPERYDDQTTIADDIPLEVKEGTFVINAPAVEYAGSDDIADMLRKAYEKAGQTVDKSGQTSTIPSREQIDIMISRGEVVVPPKIAKIIGYDRLEKINNRGKKEVARRKRAGDRERPQARQANEGGFINKDTKITVYRGEPIDKDNPRVKEFTKATRDRLTGSWFAPKKDFTRTYGDVTSSMKVTFDEYKLGAKRAFIKKNTDRLKKENIQSGLPENLTKKQKSKLFESVKYINQMGKEVAQGKRRLDNYINFLYEGVFPKEKDRATLMLLETAKRSPKAFGKLIVDSLAKNVVSKGVPIVGAVAGFAPKEMGDATLSGKEGFIYDYRTVNKD